MGRKVDDTEVERLKEAAYTSGLLCKTQRLAISDAPVAPHLRKLDGKDIVKKASTRKNRFMLVFNVQIAPAAAGKLGTLAQLNTNHPVMYIDFPEGRLKLLGTLVFPKNKYMVLKPGNKEILAEDILESMIVFSKAHWVGTLEENPEESPLPLPALLSSKPPVHSNYTFDAGACNSGALRGAPGGGPSGGSQPLSDPLMADEGEDQDDEDTVRLSQRPRRAAAAVPIKYGDEEEGGSQQSPSRDSSPTSSLGRSGREQETLNIPAAGRSKAKARATPTNKAQTSAVAIDLISPEPSGEDPAADASGKQTAAKSAHKATGAGQRVQSEGRRAGHTSVKKKRKRAACSSDGDSDAGSDGQTDSERLLGDDDNETGDGKAARGVEQRKAQTSAISTKPTPRGKKHKAGGHMAPPGSRKQGSQGAEVVVVEDDGDNHEPPSTTKRPARAAGQAATQRMKALREGDMDEGAGDGEGEGGRDGSAVSRDLATESSDSGDPESSDDGDYGTDEG